MSKPKILRGPKISKTRKQVIEWMKDKVPHRCPKCKTIFLRDPKTLQEGPCPVCERIVTLVKC